MEQDRSSTQTPDQPLFIDLLPKDWQISVQAASILLTAPDSQMELADDFVEKHLISLKKIATNLEVVVRVGWIGCKRPFQIYPAR
jgi:hypothetical protein